MFCYHNWRFHPPKIGLIARQTQVYYSCYGWMGAHVSQVITSSDLAAAGTALSISIHWTNTDWWWFSHDVSKTCIKEGMDSFISFILHRECNIISSFISFILYILFPLYHLFYIEISLKKTACMVCKSEDVQRDLSWLVPCWVKASKTWIRKKLVMATATCEQIKIYINKTIYIYNDIHLYILIYTNIY